MILLWTLLHLIVRMKLRNKPHSFWPSRYILPVSVVLLSIALLVLFLSTATKNATPEALVGIKINSDDRYEYISSNSEYTIIEFFDLNCQYCRVFHELKKKNETEFTNINLILRNYPLLDSGKSALKTLIGECVAQQRGTRSWLEYVNISYANFDKKDQDSFFLKLGESLVFDQDSFKGCLADTNLRLKIENERNTNLVNQITYVPTLVVFKGDNIVKVYEGVGGKLGLEVLRYYNGLSALKN